MRFCANWKSTISFSSTAGADTMRKGMQICDNLCHNLPFFIFLYMTDQFRRVAGDLIPYLLILLIQGTFFLQAGVQLSGHVRSDWSEEQGQEATLRANSRGPGREDRPVQDCLQFRGIQGLESSMKKGFFSVLEIVNLFCFCGVPYWYLPLFCLLYQIQKSRRLALPNIRLIFVK